MLHVVNGSHLRAFQANLSSMGSKSNVKCDDTKPQGYKKRENMMSWLYGMRVQLRLQVRDCSIRNSLLVVTNQTVYLLIINSTKRINSLRCWVWPRPPWCWQWVLRLRRTPRQRRSLCTVPRRRWIGSSGCRRGSWWSGADLDQPAAIFRWRRARVQ